MTWLRRALVVLASALVLGGAGVGLAAPASAHATVQQTSPTDGARLDGAPTEVSVTFDESVTLSAGYLRVVDSRGGRVDQGAVTHPGGDGTTLRVALKPGLADDTYTVSFRLVSADSHPVGGSFRFVVGDGPLITAVTVDAGANASFDVQAAAALSRWCTYLGLVLLGGGWLLLWRWPGGLREPRAVRLLWIGWAAMLAGAIAEVLVQGVVTAGRGLGAAFDWQVIDQTLHTLYGKLHSARLIALGVLGVELGSVLRAVARRGRTEDSGWHLEATGIAGVAVLATLAGSGHAAAASPRWLALASDMAHLAAVACWIGGLVVLLTCVLPLASPAVADRAVRSFSPVALVSVIVLAVTGGWQAWRESGTWDALRDTTYGRLVLGKIAVLVALVVVAYVTRRLLVKAVHPEPADPDEEMDQEPPTGRGVRLGALRRQVTVESGIAVVGLFVAAVLMAQPPGRSAEREQKAGRPAMATAAVTAAQRATVTVSPARHGAVGVTVQISGGVVPQSVTATAALAAKSLGPLEVPLTGAQRTWNATSLLLPSAGDWEFAVTVRTSEFDSITTTATVRIY